MNPRINLLKRSELRYQGPVSGRFIAFSSALLLLTSVLLFGSYILFVTYLQRGQLNWARESWGYLEPNYKNLMEIKSTTREIDNLLEELDGWSRSALSAHGLLDQVQNIVPANIQLTQMILRDGVLEPDTEPKKGQKVAAYRLLKMSLGGLSHSDESESAVIKLISDLNGIGGTNAVFSTVTLNSMQKSKRSAARAFSISAVGKQRELK